MDLRASCPRPLTFVKWQNSPDSIGFSWSCLRGTEMADHRPAGPVLALIARVFNPQRRAVNVDERLSGGWMVGLYYVGNRLSSCDERDALSQAVIAQVQK